MYNFWLKHNWLYQNDAYSHILILNQIPVNTVFSSYHFCALLSHNLYSTADLTAPIRPYKFYVHVTRNIILTFITKTTTFFIYKTINNFWLNVSEELHCSCETIAC
jgi:hypothetical protein